MRVDYGIRVERLSKEIANFDPKIPCSISHDDSLSDDEVDPPSPKKPKIEEEEGDDVGSKSDSENHSPKWNIAREAAYDKYMEYVEEHQGFDVNRELLPPFGFPGYCGIYPVDFDVHKDSIIMVKEATFLAIKRYNQRAPGSQLEVVEIIKANRSATNYYITFLGKEVNTGKYRNYQTKVFHMHWAGGRKVRTQVIFVRPEPEPATVYWVMFFHSW
ncbi:unnamed protein product [Cuscuta epithymum]|uniref:Cystatin domain-containing protein n=1 Tax=Cuscuta epithymum TaxID=186058 RepID=A0AAV0DT77_9ASTE|nr:unnamed protein product [Cuscuta epithymum]